MKKKYFFGIFICLVLLCSGVFLLNANLLDKNSNQNITNKTANAVTITAILDFYGRHALGLSAHIYVGTINSIGWTGSTYSSHTFPATLSDTSSLKDRTVEAKDNGAVSYSYREIECTISGYQNGYRNVPDRITITHKNGESLLNEELENKKYEPGKQDYGKNGDCTYKVQIYFNPGISLGQDNATTFGDKFTIFNTYDEQFYQDTGVSAMPLKCPTRTGYTFQGYYTGGASQQQWITAKGYPNKNYLNRSTAKPTHLNPHWTANKYTVTLSRNGGSNGTGSVTATYDSAMPNINIPSKGGYKFLGYWDKTSGGTQYYDANGNSVRNWNKASNATLYARWERNNYKIDINFYQPGGSTQNGGTFNLYKQLSGGTKTLIKEGLTNEPEKDYYLQYEGQWILENIKPNPGTYISSVSLKGRGEMSVEGDLPNITKITYTANQTEQPTGTWDGIVEIYTTSNSLKATLNYQDKGAGSTIATAGYSTNGTTLNLPSPTHTGYTFKGWSLTPNGTGDYDDDTDWNNIEIKDKNGDIKCISDSNAGVIEFNLYAIWQANDYTVRFDSAYSNQIRYIRDSLNGGSSANGANHWLEIGAFDSNGINYALKSQGATSKNDSGIVTTDYLLDGKYEDLNQWTNPGMEGGDQDYQIIDLGQLRNIEYIVVWHYYGDTRAYKDNTLEVSSDGKTWRTIFSTADTGTYTEKKNGNKVYVNAYRSKTVTYNTDYGKLPSISKTGYTFNGWYLNNTKIETNTEMTTANDHLLKSSWTVHEYNIAFDPNGGSGEMESKNDVKYDSNVTLPENAFKWAGYIFKGWNTEKNGTGTPYSDKATVKNLTSTQGTTITLYAQWEETIASDIESTFETAGTYYISTAEDLAKLIYTTENKDVGNGYTFIQTANIDLSGLTYLPIGRLNSFSATYDGQGNTISGITTYNGTDINGKYLEENSGLFANASGANITNVIIENATINGQNAGIIAGSGNSNTNILNCVVSGTVNGTNAGSIIGNGNGANISVCIAKEVNTASFASGSASIDSCIYELNDTNKTRGKSSTFNKYSEWIYPSNFAYPMPKAFMWYPYPELSESSLNDWIR